MGNLKLESERLWLIPITLNKCEELLKNSYNKATKDVYDEDTWPTQDTLDVLPLVYKTLKITKTPTGFECWMIVLKENNQVIGDIGFHSHPDSNGCVEIGYGLISSEQRKGYGYEALRLLMSWAMKQVTVKTIKAVCLLDNEPSIKLLKKVGMKEVHRDAIKIEWEYQPNNSYN